MLQATFQQHSIIFSWLERVLCRLLELDSAHAAVNVNFTDMRRDAAVLRQFPHALLGHISMLTGLLSAQNEALMPEVLPTSPRVMLGT